MVSDASICSQQILPKTKPEDLKSLFKIHKSDIRLPQDERAGEHPYQLYALGDMSTYFPGLVLSL
jgi:hypothetical protein